jgi:hypothetical protein
LVFTLKACAGEEAASIAIATATAAAPIKKDSLFLATASLPRSRCLRPQPIAVGVIVRRFLRRGWLDPGDGKPGGPGYFSGLGWPTSGVSTGAAAPGITTMW